MAGNQPPVPPLELSRAGLMGEPSASWYGQQMRVRALGFKTDVMVRRMAGSEVTDCGDHLVIRSAAFPTFYWGNFLLLGGRAAVEDSQRWLAEFRHHFPRARHLALGWDRGSGRDCERLAPLRAAGLELRADSVLTARSLSPAPHRRPGADLRPLSSDSDWDQALALRLAVNAAEVAASPTHGEFLATKVAEARRLSAGPSAAYFGAFVEGRLAAALGVVVPRGGTARFQDVETAPEHRRQGLSGSLVEMAGAFALGGMRAAQLVIVADPRGPAISLYRSLGFRESELQIALEMAPVD